MEKSQIVRIFRSFSKKELRDLRKWLLSPAHNQREDVLALYEYLADPVHINSADQLTKPVVFDYLFPEVPYEDARLRQSIHFLLKCTEEYLSYQEFMADPVRAKIALATYYRRRHIDKSVERTLDAARKEQEKQPYRNRRFLENELLLEKERYNYLSSKQRSGPFNLQEVSDSLDRQFLAEKLRQASLMFSHQAVYKIEYDWGLLDGLLALVEEKNFLQHPAIAVYYYSYLSLKERENEAHFYKLKEQILQHGDFFQRNEIRDHYLLAINFCIQRINRGEDHFVREALELTQLGLKKQTLLLEDGIISRWTFRNAVAFGTILKEFDWTENFILEFRDHLEEKHRESIVHYSLARLHFEKKEYHKAMLLFTQVEYDDMLMNLTAKTMLLKMYYEQEEFNALDSLLESMRVYLRRKKVMGYHRDNYTNIITYTKKLTTINPYDKKSIQKLESDIKESSPNTEQRWMLRQLENI
ncbi:MAG: hypothetical protein KDC34_14240 [Saprospiraceae bacterium]|nr:hypothetical protein [Saprospiraceae bacterium]